MLKDLALPKSYQSFEERFLKQPFRPTGPSPTAESWMKDLMGSPLRPSKGRYRPSVPSVELPVIDAPGEMMSELRSFGRLARLLGRANPYLSAAELALELYSSWATVTAPGSGPALNGWTACAGGCPGTPATHYYWFGSACYYDQWSCTSNHGTAPVPIGTPLPTGFEETYDTFYRSPVIAWRYVAGYHRPKPEAPDFSVPELGGATAPYTAPLAVVAPPLSEGFPETVRSPYNALKAISQGIEAATGVSVDPDGKVLGKPSSRVAVQLGPVTIVPDWKSGTVHFASPQTKTSARRSRDVPDKPTIVLHRSAPDRKKKSGPVPVSVALKVYHALTEVGDATDVLANSIAGKPCKKLPGVRKAACVLNHFSEIDWSKAIPGLIYNEIEDRVVGRFHRQLQKVTNRKDFHGPSGMQLTQFGRQMQTY